MKRECGTCTKCCEGWLSGTALGHSFFPGKPCHFISIGKGCTVYPTRPKDPCVSYKCAWLTNLDIPEWIKPSEINAIIDEKKKDGIEYFLVHEAGETLDSKVLTWLIQHCLATSKNLVWKIDGVPYWIGSAEFNKKMIEDNTAPVSK